jgi:hypothetical protein
MSAGDAIMQEVRIFWPSGFTSAAGDRSLLCAFCNLGACGDAKSSVSYYCCPRVLIRTLSKSKTQEESATKTSEPRKQGDGRGTEPTRPYYAVYVPTHATSDFSKVTGQANPLEWQSPTRRPVTAAYVPHISIAPDFPANI